MRRLISLAAWIARAIGHALPNWVARLRILPPRLVWWAVLGLCPSSDAVVCMLDLGRWPSSAPCVQEGRGGDSAGECGARSCVGAGGGEGTTPPEGGGEGGCPVPPHPTCTQEYLRHLLMPPPLYNIPVGRRATMRVPWPGPAAEPLRPARSLKVNKLPSTVTFFAFRFQLVLVIELCRCTIDRLRYIIAAAARAALTVACTRCIHRCRRAALRRCMRRCT